MIPVLRGGMFCRWYLILVPLPLVYMSSSIDPSIVPRWLWLQLGVTLLMPLMVAAFQTGERRLLIVLACFLLWSGASLLWANDVGSGLFRLVTLLTSACFMLLGLACSHDERPHLWRALVLAAGIAALVGSVQAMGLPFPWFDQAHAPASSFVNRNFASEFIGALLLPSLLLMLTEEKPRWVPVWIITAGLSVFFVLAARSRATWVALAVALIYVVFLVFSNQAFRSWLLTLVNRQSLGRLLLCGLVVYLVIPGPNRQMREQIQEEVASFGSEGQIRSEQVNTFAVRQAMWTNSLAMIPKHPLGLGLEQFPVHYPRYHGAIRTTPTFSLEVAPQRLHNDPLQILVELGFPGLLLFLGVIFLSRPLAWTSEQETGTQLFPKLVVIVVLINACFAFPLHLPATAMLFWLGLGLCSRTKPETVGSNRLLIAIFLVFSTGLVFFYGAALKSGISRTAALISLQENRVEAAYGHSLDAFLIFPFDWRALDETLSILNARKQAHPQDRQLAESFVKRHPYNANGHYRHAHLLMRLGLHGEALDAVNRALELIDDARLYRLRADVYQRLGDASAASADLKRALQLEAGDE